MEKSLRIPALRQCFSRELPGGLVWNRPGGVIVKQSDGSEIELRIRDAPRIAQLTLLAIGLIGGLAAWLFLGRKS